MNVVLGVSGSIAAYRAADLARELMRTGCTVRVCLTDSAQKFVSSALFEALTGQPCLTSVFEEPETGQMAHIGWARWANIIVVAPATANTIGKLAHGLADDMLSAICLASDAPLIIAPAMNPHMFSNAATQENIDALRGRVVHVVEPAEGDVACGEHGEGKLASLSVVAKAVSEVGAATNLLAGKRILITSGPTRESIDSVRFLSNRSSGKMGAALANAARYLGAEAVTVISGPVNVRYPVSAKIIGVETAEAMLAEAKKVAHNADIIIGAAAVADYKVLAPSETKLRRSTEPLDLKLVPNPDIIAELAKLSTGKVIGFAAEPGECVIEAREKLVRKGLAAIAANNIARPEIGFDSDQNELRFITATSQVESGLRSKLSCAIWLFEQIVKLA